MISLRYIFLFILLLHGLIHLMGFTRAFGYGLNTPLTKEISKPLGIVWLATSFIFILTTILFLLQKESWAGWAIVSVVASQILVITTWNDARLGTVANVVIMVVSFFTLTSQAFESQFEKDVKSQLKRSESAENGLLVEAEIQALPLPVQDYLRYTGNLNKPRVRNVRIEFEGEMRSRGKDWFKFNSVQYNFFDDPSRFFFMKATMFGIPVTGYHKYQNGIASMDIRLLGLFSLVKLTGPEMNISETVTIFNDMSIMVPATLIDKRIKWVSIDSTSVKATFTNSSNAISAILKFNKTGELVNFISDDRYEVSNMKQYRFSTPMKDYKLFEGIRAPSYGEAIWHFPEEVFVYGRIHLKRIETNVIDYKQ